MGRLFRFLWKVFILGSVFGIGYIIGREHSFEEEEDWDNDEEENTSAGSDASTEDKKDAPASPAAPVAGEKMVAFEYKDDKATSVSVVGDFNDWNKDKNPLKLENGVWKGSLSLKPGRHEFKFVVNNTDWITDPKGSETAPDKYGGRSSIITVA